MSVIIKAPDLRIELDDDGVTFVQVRQTITNRVIIPWQALVNLVDVVRYARDLHSELWRVNHPSGQKQTNDV